MATARGGAAGTIDYTVEIEKISREFEFIAILSKDPRFAEEAAVKHNTQAATNRAKISLDSEDPIPAVYEDIAAAAQIIVAVQNDIAQALEGERNVAEAAKLAIENHDANPKARLKEAQGALQVAEQLTDKKHIDKMIQDKSRATAAVQQSAKFLEDQKNKNKTMGVSDDIIAIDTYIQALAQVVQAQNVFMQSYMRIVTIPAATERVRKVMGIFQASRLNVIQSIQGKTKAEKEEKEKQAKEGMISQISEMELLVSEIEAIREGVLDNFKKFAQTLSPDEKVRKAQLELAYQALAERSAVQVVLDQNIVAANKIATDMGRQQKDPAVINAQIKKARELIEEHITEIKKAENEMAATGAAIRKLANEEAKKNGRGCRGVITVCAHP